jgi:hypothetical protein
MKLRIRQSVLSLAVFGLVLGSLVSVDERVRERMSDLVSSSDSLTPWGERASELVNALATAIRHQSIENAPMLVFATVGAVLFVFMFRS